ncbi:MAG TPA: phosphoribosyltransferase family protein [Hyphomicrobiaceae bacterium]|nr:phosphoribosyltransferase family protein [Hyphomicrobiaceae bacterium]
MRRRLMFADRAEAGVLLAEQVAALALADPLVLALPRGGLPVAAEIARRLAAPLDVVFVRKLGAPDQPELAVGAVADGPEPEIVLNARLVAALGLDPDYIASQAARERANIEDRRRTYAGLRPGIDPAGRSVIVVDDGVATGMTMQAALRSVRRLDPAHLVAAVPVASREAGALLRGEADDVVCLSAPRRFLSVGSFYRSFTQVTEEEAVRLLREAASRAAG